MFLECIKFARNVANIAPLKDMIGESAVASYTPRNPAAHARCPHHQSRRSILGLRCRLMSN